MCFSSGMKNKIWAHSVPLFCALALSPSSHAVTLGIGSLSSGQLVAVGSSGFSESANGLTTTVASSGGRPLMYVDTAPLCFSASDDVMLELTFTLDDLPASISAPGDLGQIALGVYNRDANNFVYAAARPQSALFGVFPIGGYTVNEGDVNVFNDPTIPAFSAGELYTMQLSLSGFDTGALLGSLFVADSSGVSAYLSSAPIDFAHSITPMNSSDELCLMFGVDDLGATLHSVDAVVIPEPNIAMLSFVGGLLLLGRRKG